MKYVSRALIWSCAFYTWLKSVVNIDSISATHSSDKIGVSRNKWNSFKSEKSDWIKFPFLTVLFQHHVRKNRLQRNCWSQNRFSMGENQSKRKSARTTVQYLLHVVDTDGPFNVLESVRRKVLFIFCIWECSVHSWMTWMTQMTGKKLLRFNQKCLFRSPRSFHPFPISHPLPRIPNQEPPNEIYSSLGIFDCSANYVPIKVF